MQHDSDVHTGRCERVYACVYWLELRDNYQRGHHQLSRPDVSSWWSAWSEFSRSRREDAFEWIYYPGVFEPEWNCEHRLRSVRHDGCDDSPGQPSKRWTIHQQTTDSASGHEQSERGLRRTRCESLQ